MAQASFCLLSWLVVCSGHDPKGRCLAVEGGLTLLWTLCFPPSCPALELEMINKKIVLAR